MTDDVLVRITDAGKSFGPLAAVVGVSLTVRPGEIVGLLGANGAGKTTLIRMLLGLETPSRGRIDVLGTAPWRADRHRIGYVAQSLGLYTELSVQQNIDFVAAAFGVAEPPEPPPSLAAVTRRPVRSIGLGRQRQLAFYCALVHAPTLLVLDEPTSGVDPLARARLWDTVHEQAAAGVGVLVTTHYMQEAEQCTRLTIMSHGRAVAEGTTAQITGGHTAVVVTSPVWQRAFTALDDARFAVGLHGRDVRVAGARAAAVERALDLAGVPATVTTAPATLEETMVLIDRDTVVP